MQLDHVFDLLLTDGAIQSFNGNEAFKAEVTTIFINLKIKKYHKSC